MTISPVPHFGPSNQVRRSQSEAAPTGPADQAVLGQTSCAKPILNAEQLRSLRSATVAAPSAAPATALLQACTQTAAQASSAALSGPASLAITYPPTKIDPVVDNYFGQQVTDNYRWLETNGPETKAWVAQQNEVTNSYLESIPFRPALKERLTQLLTTGGVGVPHSYGDKTFYFKRDGNQNQAVLVERDAQGVEKAVLDPNSWSQDGTEALDWHYPSQDGRYIAYGRSSGGDEWSTLRILDTQTGETLPDEIPRTRACSMAWLPDGSGFYYTRYPEAGSVPPGQENYNRHVFFHKLGEDPKADAQVFGEGLDPKAWPNVSLSKDGNTALISVSQGWTSNDLHLLDRTTGEIKTVIANSPYKYEAAMVDGKLLIQTNEGASTYRLMEADPANPARENWKELIPAQPDAVMQGWDIAGDHIFVTYLKDASSQVQRFSLSGEPQGQLDLPGIGSLGGLTTHDNELFYSFSSFNRPSTIYKHDVSTGETSVWASVDSGINPDDYDVKQVWYDSYDGTRVPMFLVHKKGLELDGTNPTLLYGYGGFDVSMTPSFSKSNVQWLENGGVYALANLRGGGEFGSDWHEGGMLENKQNVFDDFLTAGQTLIEQGYTSPEKLAIYGGSNGGLLIGAAVTQRPEMFKAAVCAVPLLDMLRFDEFGIAKIWTPEYGSSKNPEQYSYLRNYSPYQQVKDGTEYPATLFMSGAEDSRTDPLHARKMCARMQAATSAEEPVLIRVEEKAGHGAGKPIGKIIEAETDRWAFLYDQLGVDPKF